MDAIKLRRESRLRLIRYIESLILQTGEGGANKEKLIAEVCIQHGCARRRIVEIINQLLITERVSEIDKILYTNTKKVA